MFLSKKNNLLSIANNSTEEYFFVGLSQFISGEITDNTIYCNFTVENINKVILFLNRKNIPFEASEEILKILKTISDLKNDFLDKSIKAKNIKYGLNHADGFVDFINTISGSFKRKLFDFQARSAYYMAFSLNSCNFSVPGSGKTTAVYAAFEYLRIKNNFQTILAVGPISSALAWEREYYECFKNKPKFINLSNFNKNMRVDFLKNSFEKYDLLFLNYEGFNDITDSVLIYLENTKTMLVLDEAHKIKNPNALRSRNISQFSKKASSRIILTGTPLPNGYKDLFNLFEFVWPGKKLTGFTIGQLERINNGNQDNIKNLLNNIDPFYIRVTKEKLNLTKPIFNDLIYVPMDLTQKRLYSFLVEDFLNDRESEGDEELRVKMKKSKLIRLLQVSTNPRLLKNMISKYNLKNSAISDLINSYSADVTPPKFEACLNLVKKIIKEKGKVIIWTQFTKNIRELSKYLSDNGFSNEVLYGEIDNLERTRIIDTFHNDINLGVLIANPAAIAESISLHKVCRNAIYLDKNFNAANYMQSKDRIHRVGLKENEIVNYYFLISQNSIEEKVHNKLLEKENNMLSVIEGKIVPLFTEDFNSDISDDDLMFISKFLGG
jgi:SNF2 family DNA or RNA helicase